MATESLPPDVIQQLLALPVAAPPPGQTSHVGGPDPRVHSVIAYCVVTEVVTTALLLIRLYSQHFFSGGLKSEDFIIIIAALLQYGLDAVGVWTVKAGLGKHMWNVTVGEFFDILKGGYIFASLYCACAACVKIGILLQLIRVFAPSRKKPIWIVSWACIILIGTFFFISTFLIIFQCKPIDGAWNLLKPGQCLNLGRIYKSTATFNIIADFATLFIPIPTIVTLKMSLRRKVTVTAVFATGLGACILSVLRLYWTLRVYKTKDASYYLWQLGVTSTLEQTFGIIVFCLPKLHQFHLRMKSAIQGRMSIPPQASEESVECINRIAPKASKEPHNMPSLASFEERMLPRPNLTNLAYLPTMSERSQEPSIEKSNSVTSASDRLHEEA